MKAFAFIFTVLVSVSFAQAEVPPFAESTNLRAYSRALPERPPAPNSKKVTKQNSSSTEIKKSPRENFQGPPQKQMARKMVAVAKPRPQNVSKGQIKSQARREFRRNRGILPPRLPRPPQNVTP